MPDDHPTVYSTKHGQCYPQCGHPIAECICKKPPHPRGDGIARVRRESKERKGKTVTGAPWRIKNCAGDSPTSSGCAARAARSKTASSRSRAITATPFSKRSRSAACLLKKRAAKPSAGFAEIILHYPPSCCRGHQSASSSRKSAGTCPTRSNSNNRLLPSSAWPSTASCAQVIWYGIYTP